MTDAVVAARSLSKWYGPVIAVNDVTLAIPPGITALLGPNGAGKSTLLAMFTGQLMPTRGTLRVFGERIWGNHALNRRIGLCHQFDNFYEDMTALQFLTVVAKLDGFSARDAREVVPETLDRVGLEVKAWRRRLKTYSKGMRQRVKLAQAVMHSPDLLFLDEPMTGLDPVARREMSDLVREHAARGGSAVVSTHILHEVEALTDQILLLSQGRVLAEGDVHAIRESLETHPYAIKVVCNAPRRIATVLLSRAWVTGAQVQDGPGPGVVVVQTNRADLVFSEVTELAMAEDIMIEEISSPDDNLEAVFDYLVR